MYPSVPVNLCSISPCLADLLQGPSDRERLTAHSEVVVLQERLGISYKDAAHRLYMAELERVKGDQMNFKAFASLEQSTKKTLKMAYNTISDIDEA
jgi:hypothetical protein